MGLLREARRKRTPMPPKDLRKWLQIGKNG
jgi:hypothetical protein